MTTPLTSDATELEVVVERGPLDGSVLGCVPADTEDGYPDSILVAGCGGRYVRKPHWWVRFEGDEDIFPLYVWEGLA